MIFDCFMLFNELDLLEFRMKYLWNSVDYFVFNEASVMHTGTPKPLHFVTNRKRFKQFEEKIIYKQTLFPSNTHEVDVGGLNVNWKKENYQRYELGLILKENFKINDNDVIMVSDLDEIPFKNSYSIKTNIHVTGLIQSIYYYFINRFDPSRDWIGSGKINGETFKLGMNTNDVRNIVRQLHNRDYGQTSHPQELTDTKISLSYEKSGWHFAWLGNAERINDKINGMAEKNLCKPAFNGTFPKDKQTRINILTEKLKKKNDLLRPNVIHKIVPVDGSFPDEILNNLNKYKELGWICEDDKEAKKSKKNEETV